MDSTSNPSNSALDPQLLLIALQKNLLYQRFLHSQLSKVDELTEVNDEKQRVIHKLIQSVSTTSSNQQLKRSIMHSHAIPQRTIFAAPWFIDDFGFQAPSNPDSNTFLHNSTQHSLYPNYVAFTKRSPITPYHYYVNLASPIQNLPELQYISTSSNENDENDSLTIPSLFYNYIPDEIKQLIRTTNIPLSIPTPIAAQIIPKMEFFSPSLQQAQITALWRSILCASYQFHREQLQFLTTIQLIDTQDPQILQQMRQIVQVEQNKQQNTTQNEDIQEIDENILSHQSLQQIFIHNRALHPYYNSSIEDIIDAIDTNDDSDNDDEISLPTPIHLFEYLTGVTLRHILSLAPQTSNITTYQHELINQHPSVLESTHPHLSQAKAHFNPLIPQDAFYLLSILRYSGYLDDSLNPIHSTPLSSLSSQPFHPHHMASNFNLLSTPPASIIQYFSTLPISWILSTYSRSIYQQYFRFYHLDQFQYISQLHQSLSTSPQIINPLLSQSPLYQSLNNHLSNLPPPPASILASFNTLLEANISTINHGSRAQQSDYSSSVSSTFAQISHLWMQHFGEPYPYQQIPLAFINFPYIAQNVVKNGSTALTCYNYIMNDRQPFINEVLFFTIILYYFWYYENTIQVKYYTLLAAHTTKHTPEVKQLFQLEPHTDVQDESMDSDKMDESDDDNRTSTAINKSAILNSILGPEIATTGVYQQRLDYILTDDDLIALMLCGLPLQQTHINLALAPTATNSQMFSVDMRIQLSFPVIFNVYTRCMNLVGNMSNSQRDSFYSLFGKTPIFQTWNFPLKSLRDSSKDFSNNRGKKSTSSTKNTKNVKSEIIDDDLELNDSVDDAQRKNRYDVDDMMFSIPLPLQPSIFVLQRAYKIHFEPILIQYCKWVPILCSDTMVQGLDMVSDYIIHKSYQPQPQLQPQPLQPQDQKPQIIPTHIFQEEKKNPIALALTTKLITLPSAAHLDFTTPQGYIGEGTIYTNNKDIEINMNPFGDTTLTDGAIQNSLTKHLLTHPVSTALKISPSESQFLTLLSSIHQPTQQIIPPQSLEQCGNILRPQITFPLLYPTIISTSLYRTLASTDLAVIYQWLGRFFPSDGQDNSFISEFNYASYLQSTRTILDSSQSSSQTTLSTSTTLQSHTPWLFEEDLRLILAVKAHTRQRYLQHSAPPQLEATISWPDVAVHVPTRLPHHCRHRYLHVLSKHHPGQGQNEHQVKK